MLNFGASRPRVRGGAQAPGAPLDPHLLHYPRDTRTHTHPNTTPHTHTHIVKILLAFSGNRMTVKHSLYSIFREWSPIFISLISNTDTAHTLFYTNLQTDKRRLVYDKQRYT